MVDTMKSELAARVLEFLTEENQAMLEILVKTEDDSVEAVCELIDLQAHQTGNPVFIVPGRHNIRH